LLQLYNLDPVRNRSNMFHLCKRTLQQKKKKIR